MKTIDCGALIFDLDGTLVDSTQCVEIIWKDWCSKYSVDYKKLLSVSHGRQAHHTMEEFIPGRVTDQMIQEFKEREIREAHGLKPIKGAKDFLLRTPSNLYSIATSCCNRLAKARLENSGLFVPRNIVTADMVVNGKPDPESFLKAAEILHKDIHDCAVFEDSIMGVKAGVASGAKVIGVTTVYKEDELKGIEFGIDDFSQLTLSFQDNRIIITKQS